MVLPFSLFLSVFWENWVGTLFLVQRTTDPVVHFTFQDLFLEAWILSRKMQYECFVRTRRLEIFGLFWFKDISRREMGSKKCFNNLVGCMCPLKSRLLAAMSWKNVFTCFFLGLKWGQVQIAWITPKWHKHMKGCRLGLCEQSVWWHR